MYLPIRRHNQRIDLVRGNHVHSNPIFARIYVSFDYTSRIASCDTTRGNVVHDDCTSCNYAPVANSHAGVNDGTRSDLAALADPGIDMAVSVEVVRQNDCAKRDPGVPPNVDAGRMV